MLEVIWDELKRVARSRLFPVAVLFSILFVSLVYRIFVIQIIDGKEHSDDSVTEQEKTIETKATRGVIYDRNGVVLAYNELSYSLQIEDNGELSTSEEKNAMLHQLIHYVEDLDGNITYDMPMEFNSKGKIQFTVEENSLLKFKMNVFSKNSTKELSQEEIAMNASEVYEYMKTKLFKISDEYSDEDTWKIMALRYILYINRYAKNLEGYIPITISTNLSDEIVAAIKENRSELVGVEIVEETNRVYKDSEYFAHILGYTGTISSETLEEKQEEGDEYYSSTDQIGKTGLEAKYEEFLRGEKGYQTVVKNSSGKVVEVLKTVDPVAGNDLYLTIDAKLQKASYDLLEKELASILLENIVNSKSTGTKGKSSDGITIPIYDVYFALIDNNIIDINHFKEEDATELEKSVYTMFLAEQEQVFAALKSKLAYHSHIDVSGLSDDMASYMKQIYTSLKNDGVLIASEIDTADSIYQKYSSGDVGLNSFLVHALENNWIDLSVLDADDPLYSTEELYEKLLEYTLELLQNDRDFSKLIYYNMIYHYELSGTSVCLLLYDQGVLKEDEDSYTALKAGTVSAYSFMRNKIKKLEITPAMLALEPCSGSVVITDPNTGDTLACVSYPSYDNNKLANTVDSQYYASLLSDNSSPFVNRATKLRIAPGSTFKTFSSLVALKEGIVTTTTKIRDQVKFTSITPSPSCWSKYSHGAINVSDAIGVSCNFFFYQCGFDMSKDRSGNYVSNLGLTKIQQYAEQFGLDAVSGIELSEDAPVISTEDAVRSMIGQGTNSFAPIQLGRWVTTIANEGTSYNLTLIDKVTDVNGETVLDNSAEVYKKLDVQDSYWDAVKLGMYKVVNGESSSIDHLYKDLEVTVAGKTGTSQIAKTVPNNALFISFAPYEKPKIAVTVVIPNGYTSSNAAEAASHIYAYYFAKTKKEKAGILNGDVDNSQVNTNSVTD